MASDRTKNFVQPTIPRIDGHYDHWSMLMENFLRSKEYLQVVDSGVAEPTEGIVITTYEQALKASTFAESTNFRGRGRGRGRERGAQGHRDRSRQYQSFKSDYDQSNFSGKGRGQFEVFCDKQGIRRQLTTAYTPQ
ncbi:hypothetical protein ACOSQ4_014017 [Xanthoceras sorbifolium]